MKPLPWAIRAKQLWVNFAPYGLNAESICIPSLRTGAVDPNDVFLPTDLFQPFYNVCINDRAHPIFFTEIAPALAVRTVVWVKAARMGASAFKVTDIVPGDTVADLVDAIVSKQESSNNNARYGEGVSHVVSEDDSGQYQDHEEGESLVELLQGNSREHPVLFTEAADTATTVLAFDRDTLRALGEEAAGAATENVLITMRTTRSSTNSSEREALNVVFAHLGVNP